MKCVKTLFLFTIMLVVICINAKPFISIDTNIPVPIPPRVIPIPGTSGSDTSKVESSKEVESLDKSESIFYGYYPYYYGYPHYGYNYPLVYVG